MILAHVVAEVTVGVSPGSLFEISCALLLTLLACSLCFSRGMIHLFLGSARFRYCFCDPRVHSLRLPVGIKVIFVERWRAVGVTLSSEWLSASLWADVSSRRIFVRFPQDAESLRGTRI
ncbi:uncharacterized protein EV422DRAFT_511030 [Fimicolochytrium jonesii]|uniref:uncharacterized protein n=1 Tax=Fimicolochytrium jonesii TaxID=1396493 RepID=UPI0022FEA8D9|nr:uncharacterized protein EV422DRAFT_511030 [Fimicolochytrium jonesii]KAI8826673.1 hypothetical protein EV422DRAFT_511030 [Fimicolochytrium jonesii]